MWVAIVVAAMKGTMVMVTLTLRSGEWARTSSPIRKWLLKTRKATNPVGFCRCVDPSTLLELRSGRVQTSLYPTHQVLEGCAPLHTPCPNCWARVRPSTPYAPHVGPCTTLHCPHVKHWRDVHPRTAHGSIIGGTYKPPHPICQSLEGCRPLYTASIYYQWAIDPSRHHTSSIGGVCTPSHPMHQAGTCTPFHTLCVKCSAVNDPPRPMRQT